MNDDARHLPTARELRAAIPNATRKSSLLRAAAVFAPTLVMFVASLLLVIYGPMWAWGISVPFVGLFIGILFVIAHDAAHGSLTPYRWLNEVIGRVLFIPAGHNYSGWVHAHNHVHHGWTNLQPKDYVWSPLSLEQYRGKSAIGRWWVRFGRRWPGFGFYYLFDILLMRVLLITDDVRQSRIRWRWRIDNVFLAIGVIGYTALIAWLARSSGRNPWLVVIAAEVIPFLIAQWLIGFLTYLHHTHPAIPWFQNSDEWSFYMAQIRGTTHVQFPGRIGNMIHNIMEHNAHHVDPRIPLYNLPSAQQQIDHDYHPVVTTFGVRSFQYTQRVCQLYDYEHHCWLTYDGRPSSACTIPKELRDQFAANEPVAENT